MYLLRPSSVTHLSMAATGILFTRQAFEQLGVGTTFITLGECGTLNERYYLTGTNIHGQQRVVGEAGHALRGYVPRK